MKIEVEKSWGGRREGAGRKAEKKRTRTVAIRVTEEMGDFLDTLPNKSDFIIEAIEHYRQEKNKVFELGISISCEKRK